MSITSVHCKNVWVILTCFCLPELLTSIDDCNSDNHKWVETTQTFIQCISQVFCAILEVYSNLYVYNLNTRFLAGLGLIINHDWCAK